MTSATVNPESLFDAGLFIGALLADDPRHAEAYPIIEAARAGQILACTTTGLLSEVYAALTWHLANPPHSPQAAAQRVRELVEPPSAIRVLSDGYAATLKTLELAEKHHLTARRVHDARHAATALINGIVSVYTYDPGDWAVFATDGLSISGPPSISARLQTP